MRKSKKFLLSLLVLGVSVGLCAEEDPKSFISSVREQLPDSDTYLQQAVIIAVPASLCGGSLAAFMGIASCAPQVRWGIILASVAGGAAVGARGGLDHYDKTGDVGESTRVAVSQLLTGIGGLFNHGGELIYSTKDTVPTNAPGNDASGSKK